MYYPYKRCQFDSLHPCQAAHSPVTSAPEDPTPSSGLLRHLHLYTQNSTNTHTHTHTPLKKIIYFHFICMGILLACASVYRVCVVFAEVRRRHQVPLITKVIEGCKAPYVSSQSVFLMAEPSFQPQYFFFYS